VEYGELCLAFWGREASVLLNAGSRINAGLIDAWRFEARVQIRRVRLLEVLWYIRP